MTIIIKTKDLHPYVRKLIKDMYQGSGLKVPEQLKAEQADRAAGKLPNAPLHRLPEDMPGGFNASRKPWRYSPREVRFEFASGPNVKLNVAAFSINAVSGIEVSRESPSTWMGSDGEPNYTELVSYQGPVVAQYGHGARDNRVVVTLPTGLSDESSVDADGNYITPPHHQAVMFFNKHADDLSLFKVLVDAALECHKLPFAAQLLKKGA